MLRLSLLLPALALVCGPAQALDPQRFTPPAANPLLKPDHVGPAGLSWFHDLAPAVEDARKQQRLLLIDCTGVTCVNCKLNEKNVFPREEVKAALSKVTRVSLYADTMPEEFYLQRPEQEKREDDAEAFKKFQKATFKSEQLPLYVLARPLEKGQCEILKIYPEGKITDPAAFVQFLTAPAK